LSLLLVAGLGSACSRRPDEAKPLSELAKDVTVVLQQGTAGARVQLMPPDPTASSPCIAVVDGTRATLNGTPLRLSDFGGTKTNRSGAKSCSVPRFDIDTLPRLADSFADVLTISDGSATWTMTVENFTANHEVSLEAPANGEVSAGDWVTLAVMPADTVVLASIAFFSGASPASGSEPEFHYDEIRSSGGARGQVVEFDDSDFRFLMRQAPVGAARVEGKVGLALAVQRCDGPKACQVDFEQAFQDVPVTVVP
jgi:hypothetical protein